MQVIHLEPEEFVCQAAISQSRFHYHCIVLDNAVAGIVYLFRKGDHLFYMDRFAVSEQKKAQIDKLDSHLLHAEIYRKVALDIALCYD